LLVLTEFPPSFGGMQTHAVYLCRHLEERGYPIAVATYRHEGGAELDSTLPFPVHRCLSRIGYWHNVRVLTSLAATFRPDLIYSSTVFYGQVRDHTGLPLMCRSAGNDVQRPWIAWPFRALTDAVSRPWFEDLVYDRFRRLDWPERVEAMLLRQRCEAMCQSAHNMSRVMANSTYTAGLLESIGVESDRVRVLPGGVDAARFYPAFRNRKQLRRELGLPARKYLLLTACRLVAKKGLDLLLGALPAIHRRMPDAHLVVIGEGRDGAKCERLAGSLGLRHSVTFTGYVPHTELHRYFWSAHQK
jgi:phosphatidylinositol alpha-1,6-mannosyltransferase